jgi:hypothetical protein
MEGIMPDLYGNKTTRERELEVFIQVIIETWRDAIEGDDGISGYDAVDYICDLYRDAVKILEK